MKKLICVRGNKKLLKGQVYDCDYIDTTVYTYGGNYTRRMDKVNIVGFGGYTTSGFRFEDGSKIPLDFKYDCRQHKTYVDEHKDINVGDWVICKTDSYKSLIKGQKYQVVDVIKVQEVKWNNRHKIKLKGSRKYLEFGYNFGLVPKDVSREIALNNLFGEETVKGDVNEIDNMDEVLLKMLAKSILDPNRHKLTVLEWAIEKYGKKKINQDDFKNLLNKKLKAVLETL